MEQVLIAPTIFLLIAFTIVSKEIIFGVFYDEEVNMQVIYGWLIAALWCINESYL